MERGSTIYLYTSTAASSQAIAYVVPDYNTGSHSVGGLEQGYINIDVDCAFRRWTPFR
jgi:hypothetical protein